MGHITPAGLTALSNWQYKGGAYTPIDNMLNGFWFGCANMLPLTMAPNLVTLMGFLCTFGSYLVIASFTPGMEGAIPAWANVFAAAATFAYQTLDAMDGKQARRTGTSSPLGQLFDHGCDTISAMLLALTMASSAQLGPNAASLIFLFSVQVPFFFAQWEEYHTHTMSHSMGYIGVTEGQLVLCGLHLLGACVSTQWWLKPVTDLLPFLAPVFGTLGYVPQNNECLLLAFLVPPLVMVLSFGGGVFLGPSTRGDHKVDKVAAALQLVPIAMLVVFASVWSKLNIFQEEPRLVLLMIGLLFSFLTLQIIVCGMCRMTYNTFQPLVVGVPVVFFAARMDLMGKFGLGGGTGTSGEQSLITLFLAIIVLTMAQYILGVISQICSHLDIYCLTIKNKQSSA